MKLNKVQEKEQGERQPAWGGINSSLMNVSVFWASSIIPFRSISANYNSVFNSFTSVSVSSFFWILCNFWIQIDFRNQANLIIKLKPLYKKTRRALPFLNYS